MPGRDYQSELNSIVRACQRGVVREQIEESNGKRGCVPPLRCFIVFAKPRSVAGSSFFGRGGKSLLVNAGEILTMRLFRFAAAFLSPLLMLGSAVAESPDPLRLIPDQADLCIKLEQPRVLFDFVRNNDLLKQLQGIEGVREFYGSTNFMRFTQLLAFFEKELGANYRDIFDRLTGGGIAYGVEFGADPPQLLVIQGTDEQTVRRFVETAVRVAEEELARREAKERIERSKYRNIEVMHVGKQIYAASAGAALLVSNKAEAIQKALDLSLDGGKKSLSGRAEVKEARELAGNGAIAWMWLGLEKVHKNPPIKDLFRLPRDEGFFTVVLGGILDVAGRAPFLCAGLHPEERGFVLSFRMPRGKNGMTEALAGIVPRTNDSGSRPLLEPPGVLYSANIYLDLGKLWEQRAKLLNDKQVKTIEDSDKKTALFLAGSPVSKLLAQAGGHHRIVVAHRSKPSYRVTPGQTYPSFAFVLELRDPEGFSKRMEANLRAGALLASTQVKLKSVEEKHGDLKIVGYRFPEDGQFPADTENIRFNFTPCFATVGNQFILSSSIELCHELIDIVKKEASASHASDAALPFRERFYAEGGAQVLEYYRDRLFTQTILDQAIPPEQAQQQVQALIDIVRRLGVLEIADSYMEKSFRLDLRLQLDDKSQSKITKTTVSP
jgi:hypothetical protein